MAFGVDGEGWTRRRIGLVIQQELGVTEEVSRVGRLGNALGLRRQLPLRKDRRQREEDVTTWKNTTFPAIEKRQRRSNA